MKPNKAIHVLARAVIVDEGHILMTYNDRLPLDKQFYLFPGGHIEHGETAVAALKRKLMKEVGFSFTIGRFLGCLEHEFSQDKTFFSAANTIGKCHTHEYNLMFKAAAPTIKAGVTPPPVEAETALKWLKLSELTQAYVLPSTLSSWVLQWLQADNSQGFQTEVFL